MMGPGKKEKKRLRNKEEEKNSFPDMDQVKDSEMNWNKVWDDLLQNHFYREKVQICRTQEEVDRAVREGLPAVGQEKGDVRLKNCTYIWQPEDLSQAPDDLLLLAYCRHFGIPMRMIESRRLIIRELSMDDLPALLAIYREPGMTDYIDPLPEEAEEKEELSVYISKVYGLYNYGLWAVTDKETGALIGRAGIESKLGFPEDMVELGYQIAPHLWGMGFGMEAVRAVLKYVREELPSIHKVIARVRDGNTASVRILEEEGFQESDAGKSLSRQAERNREACQARLFELNL
ncbi:MAG: GNAT family N-acetyltransferase [Lachnospiraceae bacterium]|nr:GNAT family N-acetyltransferase [Lachnospiraceae bacterium]